MAAVHSFILLQFCLSLVMQSSGLMSNYKTCGDDACARLMYRVQAVRDHHAQDCRFLSFKKGDMIDIYYKLTRERSDLWAGNIDTQFGYFPKDAVKIDEVFVDEQKEIEMSTQETDFFCTDAFGTVISSNKEFEDYKFGDQTSEAEDLGNGDFDDRVSKASETNDNVKMKHVDDNDNKYIPEQSGSSWIGFAYRGWFANDDDEAGNENKEQETFRSRKLAMDLDQLDKERDSKILDHIEGGPPNTLGFVKNDLQANSMDKTENNEGLSSKQSAYILEDGIKNIFVSDTKNPSQSENIQSLKEQQKAVNRKTVDLAETITENEKIDDKRDAGWYNRVYNRITNLYGEPSDKNEASKEEGKEDRLSDPGMDRDKVMISKDEKNPEPRLESSLIQDVQSNRNTANQDENQEVTSQDHSDGTSQVSEGWYGGVFNRITGFYGDNPDDRTDKSILDKRDVIGNGREDPHVHSETVDVQSSLDQKLEPNDNRFEKMSENNNVGWYDSVYGRISSMYGDTSDKNNDAISDVMKNVESQTEIENPKDTSSPSIFSLNGLSSVIGGLKSPSDGAGSADKTKSSESATPEPSQTQFYVSTDQNDAMTLSSDDEDNQLSGLTKKKIDDHLTDVDQSQDTSQSVFSINRLSMMIDSLKSPFKPINVGDQKVSDKEKTFDTGKEGHSHNDDEDSHVDELSVKSLDVISEISTTKATIGSQQKGKAVQQVKVAASLVNKDETETLAEEPDWTELAKHGSDTSKHHERDGNLNSIPFADIPSEDPQSESQTESGSDLQIKTDFMENISESVGEADEAQDKTGSADVLLETEEAGMKVRSSDRAHTIYTASNDEQHGVDISQMEYDGEKESDDATQTEYGGETESVNNTLMEHDEERDSGGSTKTEHYGGIEDVDVSHMESSEEKEDLDATHMESDGEEESVNMTQAESGGEKEGVVTQVEYSEGQEDVDESKMESVGDKDLSQVDTVGDNKSGKPIQVESDGGQEGVDLSQIEADGEIESVNVTQVENGEEIGGEITQVDEEKEGVIFTQKEPGREKEGVDITQVESGGGQEGIDITLAETSVEKESVNITQEKNGEQKESNITQTVPDGEKEGDIFIQTESGGEKKGVDITQVESRGGQEGVDITQTKTDGGKEGVDINQVEYGRREGVDITQVESGRGQEDVYINQVESGGKQEGVHINQVESGGRQEGVDINQVKSGGNQEGVDINQEESGRRQEDVSINQEESGGRQEGAGINQEESGGRQEGAGINQEESGGRQEGVGINQEESWGRQEGVDINQEESGGRQEGVDINQEESGGRQEGVDINQEESGGRQKGVDINQEESGGRQEGVDISQEKSGGRQEGVDINHEESGGRQKCVDISQEESGGRQEGVDISQEESGGRQEGVDINQEKSGRRQDGEDINQGESGGRQEGVDINQEESGGRQEGVDINQEESGRRQEGVDMSQVESVGRQEGVDISHEESGGRQEGVDINHEESCGRQKSVDISQEESGGRQKGVDISQEESSGRQENVDINQEKSGRRQDGVDINQEKSGRRQDGVDINQEKSGGRQEGVDINQELSDGRQEGVDMSQVESGGRQEGVDMSQVDPGERQEGVDINQEESGGEKESVNITQVENGGEKGGDITQAVPNGEKEDVIFTQKEPGGEKEGVDIVQKEQLSLHTAHGLANTHSTSETKQNLEIDPDDSRESEESEHAAVKQAEIQAKNIQNKSPSTDGSEAEVYSMSGENQKDHVSKKSETKIMDVKHHKEQTSPQIQEYSNLQAHLNEEDIQSLLEFLSVETLSWLDFIIGHFEYINHEELAELHDFEQTLKHHLKTKNQEIKPSLQTMQNVLATLRKKFIPVITDGSLDKSPDQSKTECVSETCVSNTENTPNAEQDKGKGNILDNNSDNNIDNVDNMGNSSSLNDSDSLISSSLFNDLEVVTDKNSVLGDRDNLKFDQETAPQPDTIIITEEFLEPEKSQIEGVLHPYTVLVAGITSDVFTYMVKESAHVKHAIHEVDVNLTAHQVKGFQMDTEDQKVVMSLPDDMRPGPDLYGLPWDAVILSSMLGLFIFLLFTCRFVQAVKSRIYCNKERRMGQKVAELLEEKCKVLETLSECEHKFKKLETALQNGGLSAEDSEREDLKVTSKKLEEANAQMKSDMEKMQEELDVKDQIRKQQEEQLTKLEEMLKSLEEEAAERKSQLEQDKTTLKIHEMNTERLHKKLQAAKEENIMLIESKAQLEQEAEGWKERLSELEEEKKMSETSHNGMMENCKNKDECIKSLTECLLKMRDWDSEEEESTLNDTSGPEKKHSSEFKQKQKVQKLIDAAKASADLKAMEEDKNRMFSKLTDEIKAKEDLQEGLQQLHREKESLESESSMYSTEIEKLQHKLQIMSEMYQEKELKLHRMLTVEEKERSQKEEQLNKAGKKISLATDELKSYRQRAKELEEELEKTNQAYKNQIASHEKKAHDNWLAARAADRDLTDVKRENSVLRQRLTDWQFKLELMEKNPQARVPLFRGERSPFGPSPLGRPPSETRPFLSPPTLMDGPPRVSPQFPMMPSSRAPPGVVEGDKSISYSESGSPTWERERERERRSLGPPGPDPALMYRRPLSAPFLRAPLPPEAYYNEKSSESSFGGEGDGYRENGVRDSVRLMPGDDIRAGPFPSLDPRDPHFLRRGYPPAFFTPPPLAMRGPPPPLPPGVFPRIPLPPHMAFPPMRPPIDHVSPEPPSRPSPPGSEQPPQHPPPAHDII